MAIDLNTIYHADVLDYIDMVPDQFVQTIVTSPPYYALRSYGIPPTKWPEVKYNLFGFEIVIPAMECCLGLEPSPEAFIGHLVLIFRKASRVLKNNGILWCNIGDSYWGGKGKSGQSYSSEAQQERYENKQSISRGEHQIAGKGLTRPLDGKHPHIKSKDLIGIPWMLSFALREDGWYLRSDVIWSKPNPMPESVSDRCTKSHEYIFMLTKRPKYYFDAFAIATPYADKTLTTFGSSVKGAGDGSGLIQSENWANSLKEHKPKEWKQPTGWDTDPVGSHGSFHKNGRRPRKDIDNRGGNQASANGIPAMATDGTINKKGHSGYFDKEGNLIGSGKANKRTVWTVSAKPFAEAHFATFPPELIIDCIKSSTKEGDTVLDLFTGSGTTAVVSRKLGRNFTGCDLSKTYIDEIANPRLRKELGIFL